MLTALGAFSQNRQLLYGFSEVPQSLLINPGAVVEQQKHLGIPLFSGIHLSGGSSGVNLYDIFADDSQDINSRIRDQIFEMSDRDFFFANQQLEILNFGWRAPNRIYFSGGIYQEFDFIAYFPRDLAILAWEGNRDYLDYPFDLGQVSAASDLLTVYHFGANKKVSRKLNVGLRVKLYSSMLSAHSTGNRGTFTTRFSPDGPNIYQHRIDNARVRLNTSGIASLEDTEGGLLVSKVMGRALFGGNIGFGFDLGATYDFTDRLSASVSLLDAGLIFHSRDTESYEARGDYILDGIELIFPPLGEGEAAIPYYDNLEDELEEAIPIDTIYSAYSRWRPLQGYVSVDFGFGRPVGSGAACDCRNMNARVSWSQRVGAQLYGVVRPKGPQLAGTLYYYRRLWEFLAAKATYTVDPFSWSNLGLGLVVDTGKLNIFLAVDNLLDYGNLAKANNVSLQLGINLKIAQP
jgi:hypothetical protein